ncbi:hypothetical protein ACHAQA_005180 [Verticillium albo-atrum]
MDYFANFPNEVLFLVLERLDNRDRLALLKASPDAKRRAIIDLGWFFPLIIHPEAQHDALAAVLVPKRGANEHIRQFRRRIEDFLKLHQDTAFTIESVNPYYSETTGALRERPNQRKLDRIEDLLELTEAIDYVIRDFASKEAARKRNNASHAVYLQPALSGPPMGVKDVSGVGPKLSALDDTASQTHLGSMQQSFFKAEVFRRAFYADPLRPLYGAADERRLVRNGQVNGQLPDGLCLSDGNPSLAEIRCDGNATHWGHVTRCKLWFSKLLRLEHQQRELNNKVQASAPQDKTDGHSEDVEHVRHVLERDLGGALIDLNNTFRATNALHDHYMFWLRDLTIHFRETLEIQSTVTSFHHEMWDDNRRSNGDWFTRHLDIDLSRHEKVSQRAKEDHVVLTQDTDFAALNMA